jgi:Helix-turn-helix domain
MAKEMTSKQVAERLDVAHSTVRAWCNKGLFPNATRHETPAGSYWTIPESDLKGFKQPQAGRPSKASPAPQTPATAKTSAGKRRVKK